MPGTLSVTDRAQLALEDLRCRDERARKASGGRYGATDDDVAGAINAHATGRCAGHTPGFTCCDHARLSVLVWTLVEQAYSCNCEES